MSDLSAKFAALKDELATQAATTGGYIDTIEAKLQAIADELDTLIINNAVNTRYILAALTSVDPCSTCPPPSVIVTPPDGTIYFPGEEACKRAQAFVAFMASEMAILDVVSGLGTGTFPSLLISAINEVIAGSDLYTGVPAISFPEAVNLLGSVVNYAILNIGRGDTLAAQFGAAATGLVPLLYGATSADGAKMAYNAYINGLALPSDEIAVLGRGAYDGLFTWFFAPESTPDLTPYDGDVCGAGLPGITTCVDIVATKLLDDDAYRYFLLAPPASEFVHETAGDFFGFSLEVIEGVSMVNTTIVYRPSGGGSRAFEGNISIGTGPHVISHHTSTIDVYTDHSGETTYPFTVRVCPSE